MPRDIDYKWSEDLRSIFITFTGIIGVKMHTLDVELADLFVKINHAPTRQLQVIDLQDSVEMTAASTVIHGSSVQVQLTKCSPRIWGQLEYTGEDVKIRRAESRARAETFEKTRIESAAKTRQEQVKHSEQMQWKEDRESREMFEKKRFDAKTAAENQMYEDLAKVETHKNVKDHVAILDEESDSEPESDLQEARVVEQVLSTEPEGLSSKPHATVEELPLPPIRNQGEQSVKIGLEFSKRRQVGVPARDRPGREAPRPKAEGTGIMGVSQGEGAVEENSPMMLKERGDKMMANGDFRGAYTGRLSLACEDCGHALAALDLQLKYQAGGVVGVEECERLSNDKEKIAAAFETVWAEKKAGDDMYRQRDLAGAVDKYEKLISSHGRNPVLLANLSQFKLQQEEYQETMKLVDEALVATWSIPSMNPVVPPKYEVHLHQLLIDPPTFNDVRLN
ncbi:conserved hypothetical protein [Perkinsus marinus ATCC 50983]|uniref:CS domain-containing protein n=1 Tax=Perkinsus marinus (strain ATCC 50983 / TXsc) TaxID=423536 RepID=C5LNF0_PERM5|nr:conserved hypothetical protein [Perkinsus marinus ATCC 50983]EER01701.1 conserved hypothetical protein [Perkinsus marinus ATCC 50983]|eukprot:XP_002768983.1 conserved hypothetical protein [Perkinsus marinus ATCC 50983]